MDTRDDILRTLGDHRQQLAHIGVTGLSLFGSAARDELTADSDVDVLVDLQQKSFDAYMEVKELIERLLGRRVDLVTRDALKPALRGSIMEECVHAPGL
jgi:hypothetical protein